METCTVAHHWLIDALPIRGWYHAICKNCGEQKDFAEQEPRLNFAMTKNSTAPPIRTPEWTYGATLGFSTGLSGLL
jgi:hypothetical protein